MVVRIAGQRMYLWRAVDHEAAPQLRADHLCLVTFRGEKLNQRSP
jgi:hypothetical protein